MDKKVQYLQMIQGVITRMASNSFALKGWAVTLVAAIFALSAKDADRRYFLISYVPILVFWGLDTFYLRQERLYRALYNKARQAPDNTPVDFSLTATTATLGEDKKFEYLNCFFSTTELWFYLPLAILCLAITIIISIL